MRQTSPSPPTLLDMREPIMIVFYVYLLVLTLESLTYACCSGKYAILLYTYATKSNRIEVINHIDSYTI